MKTPQNYIKLVNQKKLTKEMIGICAFSCNKRAKNARDKQNEYRDRRLYSYHYYDKFHNESNYKSKKREYYGKKDILISIFEPNCIHHKKTTDEYFLYYEIGGYKFHDPVCVQQINSKYKNLQVEEIEELNTKGESIIELISNQFVEKVIELIQSKEYEIVA